jgi:hypothetical protein
MLSGDDWGQEKSQKLDEGVSQASDWRSRLELLESASPVAFADIRATHSACRIPIRGQVRGNTKSTL